MQEQWFDVSAASFAAGVDKCIAEGAYARGKLFVGTLSRFVEKGGRVLDYGCGPGRISVLLVDAGYEVDGRDPAQRMIDMAIKQKFDASRLRFQLCDDVGTDLATCAYDAIVCSSVIEYVAQAQLLLDNFARALKPNGILVMSYSNKRSLWRAYARFRYKHLPLYSIQCNIWTFAETRRRLYNAGFSIVAPPVYFEANPFDKRSPLKRLSSWEFIGTLGLVVARRSDEGGSSA